MTGPKRLIPRILEWNFGFEKQLGANWVAGFSYVGTSGQRLWDNEASDLNQAPVPLDSNFGPASNYGRPYFSTLPGLSDILPIDYSRFSLHFNALEAKLQKRLSRSLTLEEIRKLDAGVKFGTQFAGTKVPTFQEALEAVRGKVGIYVHIKDADPKQLLDMIESEQMLDHVVFFCDDINYLKRLQALRPDARVMPEAVNLAKLQNTIKEMQPKFIAMEAEDFHDDIIVAAKQSGAAIFVDRFDEADTPQGWQNAIGRNADGIQTNRPADLIRFLRSKGYHR